MMKWRFLVSVTLWAALAWLLLGCHSSSDSRPVEEEADGPVWFVDVTDEVGLNFVHEVGTFPLDSYFMPHVMGSGAALFDFNNDGRLDILLIQNGGPQSQATNRLYRQEENGHFTDISKGSGLDVAGHGMGVAIGDVNNDGWPDVLITEYGRIRLFLNNQGNGTFTEITKEAGLDNPQWAMSASFFDYDRDGWLDLVVVNYLDYDPSKVCNRAGVQNPDYCHPKAFQGSVAKLYHNRGRIPGTTLNAVRFTDETLKSGLGQLPGPGLGVTCADFDGDGWPDIFVANDARQNYLWINQRDGTFKEEALLRNVAYNAMGSPQGNMGVAFGDTEGKGMFSLFVTHLAEETNTLWVQEPRGLFLDKTGPCKLLSAKWRGTGFGTALADFNNDGALDLAIVNGRVSRGRGVSNSDLAPFWQPYAERNQLFVNDGEGRFRDISPSNKPFCGQGRVSRGLACGDVNNDGALDLLVTTVSDRARLYRNVVPGRGHWLLVRAIDPNLGGRDAYGATVTVRAGGRSWVSWVNPGQSYLSSHDARVHFGLGTIEAVENLTVLWPDGRLEVFPGEKADRLVVLKKGSGRGN
jgi:enediyne biosynthesis protein E4